MALTTLPTAAFATGSVGTSQLADGAVTTEKMKADVNFRNIIINGDMSLAQRGTSFTGQTSSAYYLDRFKTDIIGLGTWTISQSTDVPTGQGFQKSMKFDCTTADAAPSVGDFLYSNQPIEGYNTQSFKFGTANAESLTLSFWVKSNKTGTYIVRFYDVDNQRVLSQSYTISSASTWEKKTITISGDTVSGPNYDNGYAFAINWCLGAGTNYTSGTLNTSWNSVTSADQFVGQVNLADSTDNEWYITGVQLEVGTSASDFEFLPYDVNLQRCQRYYQRGGNGWAGWAYSGNNSEVYCGNITPMRAGPAVSYSGSSTVGETGGVIHIAGVANYTITGLAGYDSQTITGFLLNVTTSGNASLKTAGIKGCPFIMESEL
jgi:hypothetical protein